MRFSIKCPGILVLLFMACTCMAQPNITRVEYYLDTDPGYGNATPATIVQGANVNTSFSLNIGGLSPGLHIVGVRSRDANGAWSLDERWLILKQAAPASAPNIELVEWYIDNDPGYGKATPISITPGQDLVNLSFESDISALPPGLHIIGVRSRNTGKAWSLDERWLVLKQAAPASAPNIELVEWYIDTDPGYGKATPVSITPGQDLVNLSFQADIAALPPGLHIIGVRSRNTGKAWSLDERWLVLKQVPPTARPLLTYIEYYIDADPGKGNGFPLAVAPDKGMNAFPTFVNLTGLAAGAHKLFYRSRDANGAWSFDDTLNFTIATPSPAPFINVNSIASAAACKGGEFTVGYHATGTYNPGNQFIAELSNQSGSFANPLQIGAVTATKSGIISTTIPENSVNGSGYKLRIRSTNPQLVSDAATQNISLDKFVLGADTFAIVLCGEDKFDITKIYEPLGAAITWSIANPTQAPVGIHSAFATNAVGCRDTALVSVKLNTNYWLGTVSADWHNAANWSSGKLPDDSTHVIVNNTAANPCIISTADAVAASVQAIGAAVVVTITNGRKLLLKTNCQVLTQ